MSNTSIQLKKSGQTGNTPSGLSFGEVAINYADGKLYYKNALGGTSYISNQFSFDTINANNSLILATGISDTLSFVAGDNINITTNTTTKTIEISATSGGSTSGGTYANGAFIQANAAYNLANTLFGGGSSFITNGTSNVYFSSANGNIIANVGGNTITTVTSAGIQVNGGDVTGISNLYANNIVSNNTISVSGSGGTLSGANLIIANNIISNVGVVIAGTNVIPFIQSSFTQANTATTNASTADSKAVSAGTYANGAFIQANAAYNLANTLIGGSGNASFIYNGTSNVYFSSANGNIIANVGGNTIATVTNTGIQVNGGDVTGINNLYANNIVSNSTISVSGSGGILSGANVVIANNVVANVSFITATANVTNTVFANSITFYDGTKLTTATSSGSGNASFIYNGTSNVYFSSTNGNIVANVNGNTIATVTNTGIELTNGFISGVNNIYANNIVSNNTISVSGAGGTLSGANLIIANNIISNVGVVIAGTNVIPSIQSSFIQANAAFDKANTGVANTANTATTANVAINARITIVNTGIYYPIVTDTTITGSDTFHYSSNDFQMYAANNTFRATGNLWAGQFITVGSNIPVVNSTGHWVGQPLVANNSSTANVSNVAINARITVVNTGIYYPIVTDTTVTGSDTLHYSSNDFVMFASNNTFRATGNLWAGQFLAVGSNIPVVNSTGHWVGQTLTAIDETARTTANNALPKAGGVLTGNITFNQGATQIGANSVLSQDITATGNLIVSGAGGDISNANTVFANVVSLTTAAIVAGLNVVPYLQSSFAQANTSTSASTYANAAYTQANTATTNAATADSKAVTAGIYANSAYTQANSVYLPSVTRLNVTNSGASAYLISSYTGNNPTIYVTAGETIAFNLNVTGHPFMIRVSNGGTNYNTGLTHVDTNGTVTTDSAAQGQISGTLYWSVPFDLAGNNYVYQCSVHSGMVGTISIGQPSAILLSTTNSAFIQANAAFAAANAGGAGTDQYARNTANAAFIQANAAFIQANTGGAGTDQYARDTANAALAAANSAGTGLLIYNNFFTANGNTSTFNLSTSPETEDFTFVNIDGVLQLKNTYSISGNTVILTENVPANSNVEITVLGGANLDQYSRNVANAAYAQANTDFTNITITSPGTYGNATYVPVITVTSNGRINTISTIAVTGGGGGSDPAAGNTANAAFIHANAAFNAANTTTSNNASTLSGAIIPLANTSDQFNILGITGDITIYDPAGTPTEGQKLIIRIKDAGTSVNLSWNVIYRSIGVNLPSTTVASKTAYIGFVYNTTDTKWDAVAVSLQG